MSKFEFLSSNKVEMRPAPTLLFLILNENRNEKKGAIPFLRNPTSEIRHLRSFNVPQRSFTVIFRWSKTFVKGEWHSINAYFLA
jgi:hypothetical protein